MDFSVQNIPLSMTVPSSFTGFSETIHHNLIQAKRKHTDTFCQGICRKRLRTPTKASKDVACKECVRFRAESDGFVTTLIPRYVAQEDLKEVWYKREDYESFCDDSLGLVLAVELGVLDCFIDCKDKCLRGLEANLDRSVMMARRSARSNSIRTILQAQQVQRNHGLNDLEMLRGLSMLLSKDTREEALKLAASDALEAEQVRRENAPTSK